MDPQLYADFVILCVLRLRQAGHEVVLGFDGPRNYKRRTLADGSLDPEPYVRSIFQNLNERVYNCCMIHRNALRRMQNYFQINHPTEAQTLRYYEACKTACETVTRETELAVLSACRQWEIECVVAPGEADAQVAYEAKIRNAAYVISDDCDLFVHLAIAGCEHTTLLTDFNWQGHGSGLCHAHKLDWLLGDPHNRNRPAVPEYIHQDYRPALDRISRFPCRVSLFVELCVLLGNDYCRGTRHWGTKTLADLVAFGRVANQRRGMPEFNPHVPDAQHNHDTWSKYGRLAAIQG